MGFFNFFNRRRKKAEPRGVTPGGSPIYRYGQPESKGFRPPQAFGVYAEAVTARFSHLFPNRESFVFHELISDLVHIDVNILKADEGHDYQVLYTTGMSDLPMTLPDDLEDREDLRYGELFLFLPADWDLGSAGDLNSNIPEERFWPIRLLKFLARFPHEYQTWLGWGHTIPNGAQYAPLCPETAMGGVVLSQTAGDLGGLDTDDGKHINFYMVIPAYKEEIEYKLAKGMEALDEQFSNGALPMVLDIHRPNLCAEFTEILDG